MSSNFVLTVELVLVRYKMQDKIGKVPELAGCVQLGRLNLSCLGDTGSIDGLKTRMGETRDSHSPLSKTLRLLPPLPISLIVIVDQDWDGRPGFSRFPRGTL